jgi:uncharacterized membrane protein YwaF
MVIKPETTVVGDFPYFLGLSTTILIGILGYFLLKKKTQIFKKWFIFGLFMFNTILHFLKIFNSYYQERLPEYYATITFDNICAVSAILFTFTYLSKSKILKDYMFYMGIISGFAALLYPSGGVLNRVPYAFDYFRFYLCHGIILFGPIYMVAFGFHKIDYKRIFKVPFVFWGVLTIIFINTILCAEIGITDLRSTDFLNTGYERNASLVFGTTKDFEKASQILMIFVPDFLKTVPVGPYAGQYKCVPLLWLFIPSYIYLVLFSFILSIPIEYKKMKKDFTNAIKIIKIKLNIKEKQKVPETESTEKVISDGEELFENSNTNIK